MTKISTDKKKSDSRKGGISTVLVVIVATALMIL